ncbi:MAG: septum formation initiator family protein [Spirochaetaceae bacterium]
MRKIIVGLMILSIPFSISLSVYRVYAYQTLEREVERLKEEQSDLFEGNKRMIANIAIVSSPARIEEIAEKELNLSRTTSERRMRILIDEKTGRAEPYDG